MSEDERSLKGPKTTDEQPPRPDSSSSSVISRTSSPEHLEGDVFASVGKQDQLDPEKISADVAARGIVSPKKPLGTLAQTGMRGMLIAACEVAQAQHLFNLVQLLIAIPYNYQERNANSLLCARMHKERLP